MEHDYKNNAIFDALMDLLRLSGKKLEGLNNLYKLSIEQSGLISAENSNRLNEILDKKQCIMDNINEIDDSLSKGCKLLGCGSVEDLSSHMDKSFIKKISSDEAIHDCERLCLDLQKIAGDIKAVIKNIILIDNVNRLIAERYFGEIKDNIQGIYKSKRAFFIYNNASKVEKPVFFDKSK